MNRQVGSGIRKKVENWLGRDMVYPTNVLHRSPQSSGNRNDSAVSPTGNLSGSSKIFTDPGDTVKILSCRLRHYGICLLLIRAATLSASKCTKPYYQDLKQRLEQDLRLAV